MRQESISWSAWKWWKRKDFFNYICLFLNFVQAFKHAPENLLKAYLLFIYSEKILLDEKSSNALLELLEHSGITNPKRLIQFLKRESMDVSNMSKSLLSMSSGYNVTLQCEDGLIEFHMCLLAMRSKYFAAAGSERWQVIALFFFFFFPFVCKRKLHSMEEVVTSLLPCIQKMPSTS